MYYRLAEMLRTSRGAPVLCASQQALSAIELSCRRDDSAFGLLTGVLWIESKTGQAFVQLNGVIPAPVGETSGHGGSTLANSLRQLSKSAAQRGELPIGWYRGGSHPPAPKSRENVTIHRSLFSEAWQVMVVLECGDGVQGTVVRIEPSDGRAYAAPFFELLEQPARRTAGAFGTIIRWENYQTDERVVPLEERPSQAAPDHTAFATLRHRLRDSVIAFRTTLSQSHATTDAGGSAAVPRDRPETLPMVDPIQLDRALSGGSPSQLEVDYGDRHVAEARALPAVAAPAAAGIAHDVHGEHNMVTFPVLVPPRGPVEHDSSLSRWRAGRIRTGLADLVARWTSRRGR
jgi:hypothetical protein